MTEPESQKDTTCTVENAVAVMEQPVEPSVAPAVAASVYSHRPDFDPDDSENDELTVHTNLILYRFIPIGSYRLAFNYDTQSPQGQLTAHISGSACNCCCGDMERSAQAPTLKVRRQPLCNFCRLLRDAALAFPLAFMFHLVPSVIWGPENALGSSSNHAAMGVVWFVGWPVWFVLLQFLRPWGIEVVEKDEALFVPFSSWKHASNVKAWWENAKRNPNERPPTLPQKPRLVCDPFFLIGWFLLLFLFVNMIVTGVLVVQCNDRGCCKDNEDTLDCCVETGYPEC